MAGYWNLREATAATLVDGWVMTGDVGYVDADGYVFVVDRKKDMIISAGQNIYPAEIEKVVRTHPDVADVAVIGVPHDLWGEAIMAFVVPRPKTTLTRRDDHSCACAYCGGTRCGLCVPVPHLCRRAGPPAAGGRS